MTQPTNDAPTAGAAVPDDEEARRRILADLDVNMLVEAGAGSGKTTSLVGRMLALVERGTPVERIAAVTFTRKAATELRERFQLQLEARARDAGLPEAARARLADALRELDRAFLGTVHAFCGRLLRERPLELGLDPAFAELDDRGAESLARDFWRRWVERARRDERTELRALERLGLDVAELFGAFRTVVANPDVSFEAHEMPAPDATPCRDALERLLAAADALIPAAEPAKGWDPLQLLVRQLRFQRQLGDWRDLVTFAAMVERITPSRCAVTQVRWSDEKDGKQRAKELGLDFAAFVEGPLADFLRCWREHRYGVAMPFVLAAAEAFAAEREATGQLTFEDLLRLAGRLLREHAAVRDALGERYRHLLVDEFQDTDPMQAEVCFLLASPSTGGDDWRTVVPRPGSLFVVGDPKQSIYRFRRAEIQIYRFVKERMRAHGEVLALTRNFRSSAPIGAFVNAHFAGALPAAGDETQAPYSPMHTVVPAAPLDGVRRHVIQLQTRSDRDFVQEDAERVASWIAGRVARDERAAGDFLVLTSTRAQIEWYARALAVRNVPVSTTGAPLVQERELGELLIVLHAIADPENPVAVLAALEGLFFGCTPADVFAARQRGARLAVTHPPADETLPAGAALATLHRWWRLAQRQPADVLLEQLLDETGLLAHAAGEPLGDARAGALLHLVEALRQQLVLGASGLPDAMQLLETLLAAEAPDTPLRAGRTDAVRVMNVHKAKGLEGTVVVLAAPADAHLFDEELHVARSAAGRAVGFLCLTTRDGAARRVLAHPVDWDVYAGEEARFREAERVRLLYVAATRAKRELLVSQAERLQAKGIRADTSPWRPLAATLEAHGTVAELVAVPAPGRRTVETPLAVVQAALAEAEARRAAAARAGFHLQTVTEAAKGALDRAAPTAGHRAARAGGQGAAWGRAVHRGLEAAARGRAGAALDAFLRAVARDEQLAPDDASRLAGAVAAVLRSPAWARLQGAGERHVELPLMRVAPGDDGDAVLLGVIDAAARDADGWHLLDWKTDRVDAAAWAARRPQYEAQVGAYASLLAALSGEAATGEVVRVPTPDA